MEDDNLLEPDDIDYYECTKLSNIRNELNPRSYDWVLFPKEIAANQLKQAGGTCYFVSAIESLSHIPNILEYLFPDSYNFQSYKYSFKIQFYGMGTKGEPKTFSINNQFPVDYKSDLVFMKPLENEAYAIILEKAWAAITGGYKKIDGGRAFKVLNKILGTTCKCIYNEKMEILTKKYRAKEQKEIEYIKDFISENKKDPEIIFNEIKNAFRQNCPIITTSINMRDGGHEYSILGIYSEDNTNNLFAPEEFVILKNPWRSGSSDKEEEKMNEKEINKYLNSFKDIKAINNRYNDTGVFYMPKNYFKKWFRDVTICIPDYKKYFPKVYNSRNLYEAINKFYGYDSNQNYFDISQGNRLIKVNIISKKKFEETNKKIIQNNGSQYAYVYDNNLLSSIWRCKNKIGITPDYCFARKKSDQKYELYENPSHLNFNDYEIYVPNITMIDKGDKCYCATELKRINNLNDYSLNKKLNSQYLKNKDTKELDLFKSDFQQLKDLDDEIQRFLRDVKYSKKHKIQNRSDGWVNTFEGINLCSNEYADLSDDKSPEIHYHCHNLKNFSPNNQSDLLKLFDFVGKKFKCSCYHIQKKKTTEYCNEYFTFEKIIYIFKYPIKIGQISIDKSKNFAYFFNLEEKYDPKKKKSKKFFIYNK